MKIEWYQTFLERFEMIKQIIYLNKNKNKVHIDFRLILHDN